MKKFFVLSALVMCLLPSSSFALSSSFSLFFTADNVVNAWLVDSNWGTTDLSYLSNSSWSNWKTASGYNININGYTNFSLIWEIDNIGTASTANPGGFLAAITDLGGTDPITFSQGSFLSSTDWLVSTDNINWVNATSYGSNSDSTIWYNNNGGSIAGIAADAEWIWTEGNFSSSPSTVYVRVDVGTAPVPEPSTILLLGSGLLGLGWYSRKRKA